MAAINGTASSDGFTTVRPNKRQRASTGSEPAENTMRQGSAMAEQPTIVTIRPIVAKQNLSKLDGLAVAKELHRIIGGSVKRVQKRANSLVVSTHNAKEAKSLTDQTKFCNIDVAVTLGKPMGSPIKGVIMGIPHDVEDKEILEALSEQGVSTASRITKKVNGKVEKTMAILLTFKKTMPEKIFYGYETKKVRQYVPPVMRCFNCQRYGHGANQCRGRVRCSACGQGHTWQECPNKSAPKCARCGGPHSAAYLGCPQYKEAKQVQDYKIKQKVSYSEAAKAVKNINAERAEIRVSDTPTTSTNPPKTKDQAPTESKTKNIASTTKEAAILKEAPTQTDRQPSPKKPKTVESECQTDTQGQFEPTSDQFLNLLVFVINSVHPNKSTNERAKLAVRTAEKCCGIKPPAKKIKEAFALL